MPSPTPDPSVHSPHPHGHQQAKARPGSENADAWSLGHPVAEPVELLQKLPVPSLCLLHAIACDITHVFMCPTLESASYIHAPIIAHMFDNKKVFTAHSIARFRTPQRAHVRSRRNRPNSFPSTGAISPITSKSFVR